MDALACEPYCIASRYEIIDQIAVGGMAIVYRGWDQVIKRYVAIKALRLGEGLLTDVAARKRFRREAQAAARLAHPNVVAIYDFIEENSNQYLIMEYIDGINLKRAIADSGPIKPYRALLIAEYVCSALEAAHASGIIHRDIKPQNILLGCTNRVCLTDFGIVRLDNCNGLTNSGIVLGTADYLSPEQARGDDLTPASDIYSLGIVLFEMLTGEPPFKGSNPVSVAMQHATEMVPHLSDVMPELPIELDHVLHNAVHKEPRRRYRSALVMAQALRNYRYSNISPPDLQEDPFIDETWSFSAHMEERGAGRKMDRLVSLFGRK
jgi:serine/threonine protein kinase